MNILRCASWNGGVSKISNGFSTRIVRQLNLFWFASFSHDRITRNEKCKRYISRVNVENVSNFDRNTSEMMHRGNEVSKQLLTSKKNIKRSRLACICILICNDQKWCTYVCLILNVGDEHLYVCIQAERFIDFAFLPIYIIFWTNNFAIVIIRN